MFTPNDLIITMKLIKKTNKRMNDYLIFAGGGSLFAIHNECAVISKNLTFSLQPKKQTNKQSNKQMNQINDYFFFSQAAGVYSQFTTSAKFTTRGPIGGLPALPWEQGGLEPEWPPLEN
jgi:hypothetical protein